MELGRSYVLICTQVVFYCWKVHWLLDYLCVVGYPESNWINWLSEGPGGFTIFKQSQNLHTRLKSLTDVLKGVPSVFFLGVILLINSIFIFLSKTINIGFLASTIRHFGGIRVFGFILSRKWVTLVDFFLTYTGSLGYSFGILVVLERRLRDLGSICNE